MSRKEPPTIRLGKVSFEASQAYDLLGAIRVRLAAESDASHDIAASQGEAEALRVLRAAINDVCGAIMSLASPKATLDEISWNRMTQAKNEAARNAWRRKHGSQLTEQHSPAVLPSLEDYEAIIAAVSSEPDKEGPELPKDWDMNEVQDPFAPSTPKT